MTDTLTEFINVTGKTMAELEAGVEIVSNGADEQAVVRDLVIEFSNENRTLHLEAGVSRLATIQGTAKLTGHEIIGADGSLVLKRDPLDDVYMLHGFNSYTTGSYYTSDQDRPIFHTDGDQSLTDSGATSYGTNLTTDPYFVFFNAAGDVYYGSHASTTLYKRAGGFDGAQTTITSLGYAKSAQGDRYIYSVTSSKIFRLDTNDDTVTEVTCSLSSLNSSTSVTAFMDGYLFVYKAHSNTNLLVVEAATGTIVHTLYAYAGSQTSYRPGLAVNKNSAGEYVLVKLSEASNDTEWWNFGTDLTANTIKDSGLFDASIGSVTGNTNILRRIEGLDRFLFMTYNTIKVFDLDKLEWTQVLSAQVSYARETHLKRLPNDPSVGDAFGTVGIRATGVKVTP